MFGGWRGRVFTSQLLEVCKLELFLLLRNLLAHMCDLGRQVSEVLQETFLLRHHFLVFLLLLKHLLLLIRSVV